MYYRAMTEGSTTAQLDKIVNPVYLELAALGLCLFVSVIVLIVHIYYWVKEMKECCQSEESKVNNNVKSIMESE